MKEKTKIEMKIKLTNWSRMTEKKRKKAMIEMNCE